jgi:hypothetical protein
MEHETPNTGLHASLLCDPISFIPTVTCADVGSVPNNNFGWWSATKASGNRPSELVAHVASELDAGRAVALGFECPLFVPLYEDELRLTAARFGEGARAWSAGAGCGSLATGLVQLTWVLDGVLRNMNTARRAFLSWEQFASAQKGLFLWEAFVSGSTKRETHIDDAQAAVQAFQRALPDPMKYNAIKCASPVYSLAGAALLRSGWCRDVSVLEEACLVIRA